MMPYVVQATRGCVHTCDFCTVPVVWKGFSEAARGRRGSRRAGDPVAAVRAQRRLPLRRRRLREGTAHRPDSAEEEMGRPGDDPHHVRPRVVRPSGPQRLRIPPAWIRVDQPRSLNKIRKGFNARESYAEVVRRLHDARIIVQGCFVFGFDEDDKDVFAATVAEVDAIGVDIPRYSLYTPYPGTHLFQRL